MKVEASLLSRRSAGYPLFVAGTISCILRISWFLFELGRVIGQLQSISYPQGRRPEKGYGEVGRNRRFLE